MTELQIFELCVYWITAFLLAIWYIFEDSNLSWDIIFIFIIVFFIGIVSVGGENKYIPIVSIERWTEINWSFVLWFWSVDSKPVYYAYKVTWKDKYKLVTLPAVELQETNIIKPAYKKEVRCERWFLFQQCKIKEIIYVPKWTIKKRFNW